jgi:SAM-dependent methyltransferase
MKGQTGDGGTLAAYGWLHDPASRERRARRIVSILKERGVTDIGNSTALDIGCAAGLITLALATDFRRIVGVDRDADAIACAAGRNSATRTAYFLVASGEALPFVNDCFDAVICNHVYEHVENAAKLMGEIRRVLAPGGVCYFAAGHTLQLIEPHYRLPFLSWLPRSLASRYLRASGRGTEYRERFVPPWRIKDLFSEFARWELVSSVMLRDPERFALAEGPLRHGWVRRLLRVAPALAARLAPTYICLLWK